MSRLITDRHGRRWTASDAGGSAAAAGHIPRHRHSTLVWFVCVDDPKLERWESFNGDGLDRLSDEQLVRLLERTEGPPPGLKKAADKARAQGAWAEIDWDASSCDWVFDRDG